MKSKTILFSIAMAAVSMTAAKAAVLAGSYTFTGTTGNTTSFAYNGTATEDVTASDLTKVGVTSTSSTGNFRASNWSTGATNGSNTFTGTINLAKYFEFTLTAEDGYTLDLSSITFGLGRSSTGARQFQWRSSVDNYAATIGVSTTGTGVTNSGGVLTVTDTDFSATGNILDLSGAAYDELETITFRFYAYNAEATGGTGGLQGPLSFSGEVIPEPQAASLLGVLGFLGILRRRR